MDDEQLIAADLGILGKYFLRWDREISGQPRILEPYDPKYQDRTAGHYFDNYSELCACCNRGREYYLARPRIPGPPRAISE